MIVKRCLQSIARVLAICCCVLTPAYAASPTSPQIGVELYSVREDLAKDFDGTLKQLAAMGFKGVEFAGVFGPYADNPQALKKLLQSLGLKAPAAHVKFEKLSAENFAATLRFYKALGCTYLIIPKDTRAATLDGAKQVAQDLTTLEKKLQPLDLHTGYHNHKEEMLDQNGTTSWDVIATNTAASVVLEQDVAWTKMAQQNPVEFVKKYPGRMFVTHYKSAVPGADSTENAIIGDDTTDWPALITANRNQGGTKWLLIEQEVYPNGLTPLQSVAASLHGLQKILAEMRLK